MELKPYDRRVPTLAGMIKRDEMQSAPTAIRLAKSRIRESGNGKVFVDGVLYEHVDSHWRKA